MLGTFRQKSEKAIQKDKARKLEGLLRKVNQPLNIYELKGLISLTQLAIEQHSNECLKVLIEYGIPVDSTNEENTLLHIAFENNNVDAALFLIEKGANVKRINYLDYTPLTLAIRKNPSIITKEILTIFKDKGYDPQAKFSMPVSDWDDASENPALLSSFESVFGANYKSDMILEEAKEAKNIDQIEGVLKEYLTRLGVFSKGAGIDFCSLQDYESELFIKMKILKGDTHNALIRTYDLLLANLRSINYTAEYLKSLQNLLLWYTRGTLRDVYSGLLIPERHGYIVNSNNIGHMGWSYLFSKSFDNQLSMGYFKEFKDFIETNACISSDYRDIYRAIFNAMMGTKPSDEDFAAFFNRKFDSQTTKHKVETLFAIAFYISGDSANGEAFLRKSIETTKDPEFLLNVEFEHFFSLVVSDSMINEINKISVK